MKLGYFDCFSGISGEMLLGALVDAGCSLPGIEEQLRKLSVPAWTITSKKATRRNLAATQVRIKCSAGNASCTFNETIQMIAQSTLPFPLAERALNILRRVAEADARVQGVPLDQVRFQVDAAVGMILEVVGVVAGFAQFGIEEFACSAISPVDGCLMPPSELSAVPMRVIAELLRGVPTCSSGSVSPLVTPVGAAIIATLSSRFGPQPAMTVSAVGMGAGTEHFDGQASIFRLFIGETPASQTDGWQIEDLVVLEAAPDDMNPQTYGYFSEIALTEGALDVYARFAQMKQNRPGVIVTLLCKSSAEKRLTELLFLESSAPSVRRKCVKRRSLRREHVTVATPWGPLRVKIARNNGRILNVAPEYEDCKNAAARHGVPLKLVLAEAVFQFRKVNRE